jgi:hypothetical protein
MESPYAIWSKENWIQFTLYDSPDARRSWKEALDWYHDVLRTVVRPVVESQKSIQIVLFTHYGPSSYQPPDRRICQRALSSIPDKPVRYIRLRIFPLARERGNIITKFEDQLRAQHCTWDYEILTEYDVLGDLGNRFGRKQDGSIEPERTLRFVRYWDAGCRYILSVIADSGNWEKNVEIWAVPHLINNALGSYLRHPNTKCPNCGELGYMETNVVNVLTAKGEIRVPTFAFGCPKCGSQWIGSTNI